MNKVLVFALLALFASSNAFAPSTTRSALARPDSCVFAESDDVKPLEVVGESPASNSEEEIQKALDEFKQQSQIKAFGILGVAFSSFVYLKLQYDADPSNFIGSH